MPTDLVIIQRRAQAVADLEAAKNRLRLHFQDIEFPPAPTIKNNFTRQFKEVLALEHQAAVVTAVADHFAPIPKTKGKAKGKRAGDGQDHGENAPQGTETRESTVQPRAGDQGTGEGKAIKGAAGTLDADAEARRLADDEGRRLAAEQGFTVPPTIAQSKANINADDVQAAGRGGRQAPTTEG